MSTQRQPSATASPTRVLAAQRRARLQHYVLIHQWATVRELAAEFGTSPTTIRRDLDTLAAKGALLRVHGGAGAATG
jgi:DeoR/GlpR family transcriptional regulator of sugar metabolism